MRAAPPPRALRPALAALGVVAVFALGLLALSAFPATARATEPTDVEASPQTWSLGPANPDGPDARAHLLYEAAPGQTISDTVAITNYGDSPLLLDLYASDAFTPPDGGFDLLPRAQSPTDIGAWLAVGSPTVEVAPRQTALVPVTLTVPADATPGDHAGGIVAALVSTVTDADGQQVAIEHRVGTRVHLRVDGPLEPSLEITDLGSIFHGALSPASPGRVDVVFTVTNTGNIRLSGQQSVTVTGPAGVELGRITLPDLPELLPGASVKQTARVDGTWPALRVWTHVEIQPIDESGQVDLQPIERTATLWAVPWGQLALLLLVLGAVLLGRRRRRRARVDPTGTAEVPSADAPA